MTIELATFIHSGEDELNRIEQEMNGLILELEERLGNRSSRSPKVEKAIAELKKYLADNVQIVGAARSISRDFTTLFLIK